MILNWNILVFMSERELVTESFEMLLLCKCIVCVIIESWNVIDFVLNIKYRFYIEYCKSFLFEWICIWL